ncbi:MAG: TM2 domain-containing protein [Phycisphaerae bacterium]
MVWRDNVVCAVCYAQLSAASAPAPGRDYCHTCGAPIAQGSSLCARCGETSDVACTSNGPIGPAARQAALDAWHGPGSSKRILPAFLLCVFFGFFGVHRFYAGTRGTAYLMLIITLVSIPLLFLGIGFLGILFIFLWWFLDSIVTITGGLKDGEGNRITVW